MKAEVILLSEIDDYIKYKENETDMKVRLKKIKETQEYILKELKTIQNIASCLKAIRQKYNFSTDKEMLKQIQKYAR